MAISSQQVATSEPEPWRDLRGKIVMVTDASSGIGWEFCIDLAKSGCRIIAAARRTNRLKALCDEINNLNISDGQSYVLAIAMELDVSADGPTIKASVQKAWDAFGHIDALINNCGVTGDCNGTWKTQNKGKFHMSWSFQIRDYGGSRAKELAQECGFKIGAIERIWHY